MNGRLLMDLAEVDATMTDLVGGKAAGLGELIRLGERVPAGFCLTTRALPPDGGQLDDDLRAGLAGAYRRLGEGPVAVRSSATAEDLPYASFAGQQDTFLNVAGLPDILDAVRACGRSLHGDRATRYRTAVGVDHDTVRMAVIVQRMVAPAAAGVLFTANPVTGGRGETVVDAAAGLGDVVVDGIGTVDHYVLAPDGRIEVRPAGVADRHAYGPGAAAGCLTRAQLDELRAVGERLQAHTGTPQDIEWAFDHAGQLWLLQSRPITTLFPAPPPTDRPRPRLYISNGPVQGMLRPYTPMGLSAMRAGAAAMWQAAGVDADPIDGPPEWVDVAGRMYLDVTDLVHGAGARRYFGEGWLGGARGMAVIERFLADPQCPPPPDGRVRRRTLRRLAVRSGPAAVVGILGALARPAAARARAARAADRLVRRTTAGTLSANDERLRFAVTVQRELMRRAMGGLLWPVLAGYVAAQAPVGLLAGSATATEVDGVLRGVPHNVTTEMDLALWRLASRIGPERELLVRTPPAELAARYRAGELPDIGLDEFLSRYGRRAVAEIDIGLPRWAEDPTPVFAMLANLLRVCDPERAPDRRFARAAAEADATLRRLVARARPDRPVRAWLAGWLLRRARALAGLRELPKFVWLHALAQLRQQLLAVGADLAARGRLDGPDDVMFLDLREASAAVAGADLRELVAARRRAYEREVRRRYVPRALLCDGTDPEALAAPDAPGEGVLTGTPAAPGTVTGLARVVLDPAGARLEPGEILVAPTTDPGWTPLFLTAGGLVTETGTPIAHGPTVAREYGLPAVVGVRNVTTLIRTGDRLVIDGAAGTVAVVECLSTVVPVQPHTEDDRP